MAWVTLLIAGLFETGWAIGLKYTMGFTRLWPPLPCFSIITGSARAVSISNPNAFLASLADIVRMTASFRDNLASL